MPETELSNEESSSLLSAAAAPSGYGSQAAEADRVTISIGSSQKTQKYKQYIAALSASGGALAAGLLLGWTSPAELRLVEENEYPFKITAAQFSWIGSAMTLGAASVCMPIGYIMDLIGRKLTMLLLVLPFTLGWALLIWATNVEMMYAARFILGISGGAFCITAPLYTGEIAEKEIRGALGAYFQLMITIGILLVYILGSCLSVYHMTLICGLVPIIFGSIFFFMPETPVFLVRQGKTDSAIKSMKWLRGPDYDTTAELAELQEQMELDAAGQLSTWNALLRRSSLRSLAIGLGLMFFQQLSGINAVIFYTNAIFAAAHTNIDGNLSTILVGLMQVVATFVSTIVVDRLGRRMLLLASAAIMVVCTVLLGVFFFLQKRNTEDVENLGWLPVVSLCVFIIMFSIGFGPIPWLMLGELFATNIKTVAGSIAGTSNWLLAFLVTKTFSTLTHDFGTAQTFWFFSAITFIGVIFVFLAVPETKGKSLVEIQEMLNGNNRSSQLVEEKL